MDYIKQLKKNDQKIAEIMDIFNKKNVEGTFQIQVDNSKYIKKEDFKILCSTISLLFYQMTDSWREYVIDIEKEVSEDKEVFWKWKLNDKGKKIYDKRAKQITLK